MRMRDPDDVVSFLRRCIGGDPIERAAVIVMGLGPERYPSGVAVNDRRASVGELSVSELVLIGEEFETDGLLAVELATGDAGPPSASDLGVFEGLVDECDRAGLVLVDAIRLACHRWWSYRALRRSRDEVI
jgi:hypothetical protein